MSKKSLLATAVMLSLVGAYASAAHAEALEEGNWMVRVRVLKLDPANKSTGGTVPADSISVSEKIIPDVDVSYFFSKNFAAELVLTVPQKHDVFLNGTNVGSFKHLPPTLLGQYHFDPIGKFRPYLGAGINYTRISDVDLAGGAHDLESSSWGPAFQAGFDYQITRDTFVNFDVKKIQIRADVTTMDGVTVKVDPLLWGVGLGVRF